MQSIEKPDFAEFPEAFAKRYQEELQYVELVSEEEMLEAFWEYEVSGKAPEQSFEQQERSELVCAKVKCLSLNAILQRAKINAQLVHPCRLEHLLNHTQNSIFFNHRTRI
jgi:hypothetical protein